MASLPLKREREDGLEATGGAEPAFKRARVGGDGLAVDGSEPPPLEAAAVLSDEEEQLELPDSLKEVAEKGGDIDYSVETTAPGRRRSAYGGGDDEDSEEEDEGDEDDDVVEVSARSGRRGEGSAASGGLGRLGGEGKAGAGRMTSSGSTSSIWGDSDYTFGGGGRARAGTSEPEVENEFGTVLAKVIGVTLFNVKVEDGSQLTFQRMENTYDPNAVRVNNLQGTQVGFLDRSSNQFVAALLDWYGQKQPAERRVRTEAIVSSSGPKAIDLRIHVYGPERLRREIEERIRKEFTSVNWVSVAEPTHINDAVPGADKIRAPPKSEDDALAEEVAKDLDKLFKTDTDWTKYPPREPHSSIKTSLYIYQKQALHWLFSREERRTLLDSNEGNFIWERRVERGGHVTWYNTYTGVVSDSPPEHARGGILADEMGLGKTLQFICLIAGTSTRALAAPRAPSTSSLLSSYSGRGMGASYYSNTTSAAARQYTYVPPTLIICPLSVMSNWQTQVDTHVVAGHLKVYTYHGSSRETDPKKLRQYDVVITTYDLVGREWRDPKKDAVQETKEAAETSGPIFGGASRKKKAKEVKEPQQTSPLYLINWNRIILDEAHTIREPKTRMHKACLALQADKRWCITGTPVQNKVTDLYGLFSFLRIEPYNTFGVFTKLILEPLKRKDRQGLERLQTVMAAVTLRRKKNQKDGHGVPLLNLPPKTARVVQVELKGQERIVYDALATSAKRQFQKLIKKIDEQKGSYAVMLQMLLRMRQACDHIGLVPQMYHRGFLSLDADHKAQMKALLALLDEPDAVCGMCAMAVTEDTGCIVKGCEHIYCKDCLDEYLKKTKKKCPVADCSTIVEPSSVVTKDLKKLLKADEEVKTPSSRSAKLNLLIEEVKNMMRTGPDKAIVFSQWTSFLDVIETALKQERVGYVRLDGAMTFAKRQENMKAFQKQPHIRIFLISLKAGGLGLNLTAGNRVYMMDPWWNPAVEDQAVDRVHRLGQTKPVEIVRFIVKDSVEERIILLQNKKRDMVAHALGGLNKSRDQIRAENLEDLKLLFK